MTPNNCNRLWSPASQIVTDSRLHRLNTLKRITIFEITTDKLVYFTLSLGSKTPN